MRTIVSLAMVLSWIGAAAPAAAQMPSFTDEAVARGLSYVVTDGMFDGGGQFGCGVALCDLDGDGDDDIVASGATGTGGTSIAVFRNDGGTFVNRTTGSGLTAATRVSGIVAGDTDGDGDLDLFVTRWLQPAMLFRNNGNLVFSNITSSAGLSGNSGPGTGCSFADFDADGDIDLAIANRTGSLGNQLRNRFYRNNGSGTFTEISQQLGVDDGGVSFQCLLQDLDRDGDPDLYVSNDKGWVGLSWNRYFRNVGGAFVDQPNNGACVVIDSMGVATGDVDGNGFIDIYCTNTPEGHVLLLSDSAFGYADAADTFGAAGATTGWGTLIFDPDNDGDQDIFACSMAPQPDYLFVRHGPLPMIDLPGAGGASDAEDSYCLAAGDIDLDGDVDLLKQSRLANLRLLVNASPAANRAVRLKIVGRGMNTHAIGALVDVRFGKSTVLREVLAGSSYKSQSSYVVHAGIGPRDTADSVIVRWPKVTSDGGSWVTRTLTNVPTAFVLPVFPPMRLGDVDGDGRVEPAELAGCAACVGAAFSAACAIHDFDGNCAVDALDLAASGARLCDLDQSGSVGEGDLSLLLAGWGGSSRDLTGDGVVDSADLGVLLAHW
jgi:enediyne biosynthesis protein E4